MASKKITLTMPEDKYNALIEQASKCGLPLNRLILNLIDNKAVIPGLQEVASELHKLRTMNQNLLPPNKEVEVLCQYCESSIAKSLRQFSSTKK